MAAPVPPSVPIDQRFAQLIKQFGLTKNSFAMSLGKTASVVQHLIDGRNKPGYDLLCKVFEIYPNVSRDWLLLGRGSMLVSGEPAPKPVAATAPAPPARALEPIDLTDVEPVHRRAGGASSRLQPAEIVATLALAAAVNQPVRAAIPAPPAPTVPAEAPAAATLGATSATAEAVEQPYFPSIPEPTPAPGPASPTQAPAVPPLPGGPSVAAALAPPALVAGFSPEAYLAGALHAQHLQHQLALAELRNQHLQEQQNMLREMLAMARQRPI